MRCKRCGTEIMNGMTFCSNCGTRISVRGGSNSNQNNKILVVLIIILAFALSIWGGMAAYMVLKPDINDDSIYDDSRIIIEDLTNQNGGNVQLPVESEEPEDLPSHTPKTKTPTPVKHVVPARTYDYPHIGLEDGLLCKFPSNFYVYPDGLDTQYTVKTSDGSGKQLIDVVTIYGSTYQVMNEYINTHSGAVTINEYGDNYFKVQITNDSQGYYKYGRKINNKLYTVELIYPSELTEEYERVMDDVSSSLYVGQ